MSKNPLRTITTLQTKLEHQFLQLMLLQQLQLQQQTVKYGPNTVFTNDYGHETAKLLLRTAAAIVGAAFEAVAAGITKNDAAGTALIATSAAATIKKNFFARI